MELKDQKIIVGGTKATRNVRSIETEYDQYGACEVGEATFSGETVRVKRYKPWPAQMHLVTDEWYKEGETPNLPG
jgi:hypothetical protein